ncbi:hypothetical protein VYU27_001900 [Nannochloropsis oceanica]
MVDLSGILLASWVGLVIVIYYGVVLPLYRRTCRRRLGVAKDAITVAFFHPYCNAGGGGERVLWLTIKALASLHAKSIKRKQKPLHVFIYTGDHGVAPDEILRRAEAHFAVNLTNLPMPLSFVFVRGRQWLEAPRYPVLTMVGQSLGSILLAFVCLGDFLPDVFFDTTGCAFTYPVAALLGRCRIAAYVHYPTISTDMLSVVREQRPSYNNDRSLACSPWKSRLKLIYYHAFACLYGLCGFFVSLIIVNSSWTQAHIRSLWWLGRPRVWTVFPPCDTSALKDLPLAPREPVILSVGQFRPEKEHPLQIRAFARFLNSGSSSGSTGSDSLVNNKDIKLVLLGSCRGAEDERRVAALRALAAEAGVGGQVEFVVGAPYPDLKRWLGRASVGVHTMWNEHFGICVVEYMAAGLVTVAHNSGGPKADIVVPFQGAPTGILAATEEEYAQAFARIFAMNETKELTPFRISARASIDRFSDEVFLREISRLIGPFLGLKIFDRRESCAAEN